MRDLTVKLNLALDQFGVVLGGDVFEADNFNSVVFVSCSMYRKFNDPERAISKFFLFEYVEFLNRLEMTFGNNFHTAYRFSIVNKCILLLRSFFNQSINFFMISFFFYYFYFKTSMKFRFL